MDEQLFVSIKLSDVQARLLATAAWPGNTTHNVWSSTGTRRDSFNILHALGLITRPAFGAKLTRDGLDVASQIQKDPELRAFDIPYRGMDQTTARRRAKELEGVARGAKRLVRSGRWTYSIWSGDPAAVWIVTDLDGTTVLDSGPARRENLVDYVGPENEGVDW
jgi:hypothetical protein